MTFVIIIIVVALLFDFLNGFHDSANSIATVVTTRVLSPRQAVTMAAIANFIGAFVFTTAVAATIAKGIVIPAGITSATIFAGLIGACIWNLITWYLGLPTSSSHALIGGLIGAVLVKTGVQGLVGEGILRTFIFIILAPLIGSICAMIFTTVTLSVVRNKSTKFVSEVFKKLQIASAFMYSVSHGTNDAQKTMGIISLTLFTNNLIGSTLYVPLWVILSSHFMIAAGTYLGGWKIVKTMGSKIFPLKPFEGFCAEISSAATLFTTAAMGIPVSTTHVIAGSIIGVGTIKNHKKVQWITTRKIFLAWIITIPAAMTFGAIVSLVVR